MSESLFQKPLGILGLLGASFAGPYFFVNSDTHKEAANPQQPIKNQPNSSTSLLPPSLASYSPPQTTPSQSNIAPHSWPIAGQFGLASESKNLANPMNGAGPSPAFLTSATTSQPVFDFREVLRFDMTPNGVIQRFPRTTTVLSEIQLDGMRVPFVSGTASTDVAGTLTYYFDNRQSLRRVQMHGAMGEPSMLINLMTQYYHLKQEQTLGGYLYTTRWNNRVTSLLQLNLAPVIESGDQLRRYRVFLELNQPSMEYTLSSEAEQTLRTAQQSGRW